MNIGGVGDEHEMVNRCVFQRGGGGGGVAPLKGMPPTPLLTTFRTDQVSKQFYF